MSIYYENKNYDLKVLEVNHEEVGRFYNVFLGTTNYANITFYNIDKLENFLKFYRQHESAV